MNRRPDAEDVLVFHREANVFRLAGGHGRGEGWANIVELSLDENPIVERAWRSGVPVRISGKRPVQVCGPYWARNALVVPVGQEHLVVFGGPSVARGSDGEFVATAARTVAQTNAVSAEKLLADELEVVLAVRAMTAYQPTSVRDTARHIAKVAARALSCDVAAVRVRAPHGATLEALRLAPEESPEGNQDVVGRDAERFLDAAAAMREPMVEQTVDPQPEVWTNEVVSRMTLPIGAGRKLGAMSLGHAAGAERGFTSLCQRIGRALAESAEPLLLQAISHEQLANERELFQRQTCTDPLTGVGNRAAWEIAISAPPPVPFRSGRGAPAPAQPTYAVLSADLDDLKQINDKHGHAAGDAALCAAAALLGSVLRAGDVLCRVGGDEFLALLPGATERQARKVVERIADQIELRRDSKRMVVPSMSVGWAAFDGDWPSTVRRADERMYAEKRRRDAQPPQVGSAAAARLDQVAAAE